MSQGTVNLCVYRGWEINAQLCWKTKRMGFALAGIEAKRPSWGSIIAASIQDAFESVDEVYEGEGR